MGKNKHQVIPGFLIVLAVFSSTGVAAAVSGEPRGGEFFIPEAISKAESSRAEALHVVPVTPGEEIPDWTARWELARVLSYVGKYDEAVTEYRKLLAEKPDLAEARIELANVFYWKGKKQEALEMLEGVSTKDLDVNSRVLLADIHVAQGKYREAEPLYRQYLDKHPEDLVVRLKLAEMLSWEKKYGPSLSEYEKILDAKPDDTQIRRRYAFVLIWAGRHQEAAAELRKTLD
jgi:tetratricopeptide (TPR) repeat protein